MFEIEKSDLQEVIAGQATQIMNMQIENASLKRVINELQKEIPVEEVDED